MKKQHFEYTYVFKGLDCPPSVEVTFKKILFANGIDRIDTLCRKTEEEVMCIDGLTPYMQKKLRDFMDQYDLKFGMTDDEIDHLGKGGNDGKYEDQMSFYSEEDDDENKNA